MLVVSFFLTLLLFFIGYLVLSGSLMQSMYEEVFASNSQRTLQQVQSARFDAYIIPVMTGFTVVWMVLATALTLFFRRKPKTFKFGDTTPPTVHVETGEKLNFYPETPEEFEERVAWLITQQTGYQTKVTGGAGDRGADVKVYDANRKLVGIVQCKRYHPRRAVPPTYIQQMVGIRETFKVNIVYLATTSYFTEESHKLAKRLNVRLIDGRDLKHITKKTAI